MTKAMPTGYIRIGVDVQPPAVRVVLQNPPLNVIDHRMLEELHAALEVIEQKPEISVIVITGSENCFSAGVDVAEHAPDRAPDMLRAFHSVIRLIVSSRKLTVAVVRRHCLGGGAELAMMCDIIFATADSVWGFPEIKLACFPPVASVALPAIVGQKLAAEMILTGRTLTGNEALAAGLVNGIADDPETLLSECTQRVSQLSTAALAYAKKALYAWDSMHFDKGLARAEHIYIEELMKTDDAKEGVAAFLERRRPHWTGT